MNKILILLLSVMSISAGIFEVWGDEVTDPIKLEGDDLCVLGNFLTAEDKIAVSEIQVEDIQHVPLTTSAVNLMSVKPRASVVAIKRSLLGSGAHRMLETDIALEFQVDESSHLTEECDLILLEKLSNGVFADPFQLQRLNQQGSFNKVHIYGDVDLERPARMSYPSIVEIHAALLVKEAAIVGTRSEQLQAKVSLPLHARYPPTSAESYFQLTITMPQVLVKCKKGENTSIDSIQEICTHTFTEVPAQTVQWSIPTGSPVHSTVVDIVTTGAALIGVISVFLTSKKSLLMNNARRTQVSYRGVS